VLDDPGDHFPHSSRTRGSVQLGFAGTTTVEEGHPPASMDRSGVSCDPCFQQTLLVGRTIMALFRVFLRGTNFLLEVDGKSTLLGFYATRFVEAANREGAELLAIDLIRNDDWLQKSVSNDRSDPPMLFADEIEEIDKGGVNEMPSGFSFFPMKEEADA
jgi:hypothetical protein